MHKKTRNGALAPKALAMGSVLALSLTACAGAEQDGEYPSGTIEWIVPFGPGGGADNYSRQLTPLMSEELGVNIQIDNIEGVGGLTGMRDLAEADADGYTLGTYNPPATNVAEMAEGDNAGVDLRELTPIASYGIGGWVMIAQDDAPVDTLQDVIDQYQSGEWTTLGAEHVGGPTHLIAELMKERDGLEYDDYVGYEGGEVSAAVLRDEVPVGILTDSAALSAVESGDAKVISVLYEPGSEFYPDAPTAVEQGFSDTTFVSRLTRAVWGPPGLDQEVVDVVADAVETAVNHESTQEWSDETGSPVEFGDASEVEEALEATYGIPDEVTNLEELLGASE